MYVVLDELTGSMIGPFSLEQEAVQFTMEAEDLLNDASQNLTIYQLEEPQEWAFSNLAQEVVA